MYIKRIVDSMRIIRKRSFIMIQIYVLLLSVSELGFVSGDPGSCASATRPPKPPASVPHGFREIYDGLWPKCKDPVTMVAKAADKFLLEEVLEMFKFCYNPITAQQYSHECHLINVVFLKKKSILSIQEHWPAGFLEIFGQVHLTSPPMYKDQDWFRGFIASMIEGLKPSGVITLKYYCADVQKTYPDVCAIVSAAFHEITKATVEPVTSPNLVGLSILAAPSVAAEHAAKDFGCDGLFKLKLLCDVESSSGGIREEYRILCETIDHAFRDEFPQFRNVARIVREN